MCVVLSLPRTYLQRKAFEDRLCQASAVLRWREGYRGEDEDWHPAEDEL